MNSARVGAVKLLFLMVYMKTSVDKTASLAMGVQEKLEPGICVGNMYSHIAFAHLQKVKGELGGFCGRRETYGRHSCTWQERGLSPFHL